MTKILRFHVGKAKGFAYSVGDSGKWICGNCRTKNDLFFLIRVAGYAPTLERDSNPPTTTTNCVTCGKNIIP